MYIPADKLDAVMNLLSSRAKSTGIYAIRNNVNKKAYVGSSENLQKRWLTHRSQLQSGSHSNKGLQQDWNKHGAEAFAFSVLEIVQEPEWLSSKEREWMKRLESANPRKGYNENSFVIRANKSEAAKQRKALFLEENIEIPDSLKNLWSRQTRKARGFMWVNGYIASKHLHDLFGVLKLLESLFGKQHPDQEISSCINGSSVENVLAAISQYTSKTLAERGDVWADGVRVRRSLPKLMKLVNEAAGLEYPSYIVSDDGVTVVWGQWSATASTTVEAVLMLLDEIFPDDKFSPTEDLQP